MTTERKRRELADRALQGFDPLSLQRELFAITLKEVQEFIEPGPDDEIDGLTGMLSGTEVAAPLSKERLLSELANYRLLLLSQYQTLPECRRGAVDMLSAFHRLDPERPLAVTLDCFGPHQQELLDRLAVGVAQSSEDDASNEKQETGSKEKPISLEQFDALTQTSKVYGMRFWLGLLELFKVARSGVKLLAADVTGEGAVSTSVDQRNMITASVVEQWLQAHPNGLCIALVGEARLLSGTLPEALEKRLGDTVTPAIVLQAWEEGYWRLAETQLDPTQSTNGKHWRWRSGLYSTTSVPPLVKLDSFLTWARHVESWPGWPPDQATVAIRRQIQNTLGLQQHLGWQPPEVYCCGDLRLLQRLAAGEFSDDERRSLVRQICLGESYYLPGQHLIYLGTLSGFHMGEEVAHALRIALTDERPAAEGMRPRHALFYTAVNEAAGYLGSKIVAPGRAVDKEELESCRELGEASDDAAFDAWSEETILAKGHGAGYALGELLYRQLQRGEVEREDLQPLFMQPAQSEGRAEALFNELYEKAQPHLTAGTTLKSRVGQAGVIYFIMFLVALLWGGTRGLFQFPVSFVESLPLDLGYALGAAGGVIGLSWVLTRLLPPLQRLSELFKGLLGPLTLQETLLLSSLSAIGEEFLFRGVLQAEFGLVIASLLFGLVHFIPDRRFYFWTIVATAVGFLLGWIYVETGNLLVPVATHFLINFVNITLIVGGDGGLKRTR